ncbi:MAG: LytTR family transcriptional regulator [Clostridia bacterium]|nr:LytTR family transcriptional regulator [Clostridia bacterium]
MKCKVIIDPSCDERIEIYAKQNLPLVEDIKRLAEGYKTELIGYKDKEIVPLDLAEIICIAVISNKVYAICEKENYLLKERLYVVEAGLPDDFLKINQSCLANVKKIKSFDASISGTLKVHFQNGYTDYVSRRQLKAIKERLGIL